VYWNIALVCQAGRWLKPEGGDGSPWHSRLSTLSWGLTFECCRCIPCTKARGQRLEAWRSLHRNYAHMDGTWSHHCCPVLSVA
jgi:hypothetical protein